MIIKNTTKESRHKESRHIVKLFCSVGVVVSVVSWSLFPFVLFSFFAIFAFIFCNTVRKDKDEFRMIPAPWTFGSERKQYDKELERLNRHYEDGLISEQDMHDFKQRHRMESK